MKRQLSVGPVLAALAVCTALFWVLDVCFRRDVLPLRPSGPADLPVLGSSLAGIAFRFAAPALLVFATVAVIAGFSRLRPHDPVPASPAADRELRAQRHLQMAIETVPVAFALYDADDRMLICNRLYRSLWPLQELQATGFKFEDLVRATAYGGFIAEAAGREEEWIAERMARHRNPSGVVEVSSAKRHLALVEHRTPDGFTLLVVQDISELRRTEDDLRRALHDAEIANRAKTAFLANMSHELRTPLNCVIGFSDIIADEVMGPLGHPKYKEYACDIRQAGRDLLGVINDILDLSRMEQGRIELRDQTVSVAGLLAHCSRVFATEARAVGLDLAIHCPADLPAIRADEHRVRQVLFNLLSNAVKFTRPGGTVTVVAGREPDGGVTITVADTGIGMTPECLGRVTDLFAPVEDPYTRAHCGAGLGLPLSRGLMELHGGRLTLESRVGVGTTATVRFPPERTLA